MTDANHKSKYLGAGMRQQEKKMKMAWLKNYFRKVTATKL